MTEAYVAARDAGITVALLTNGKRETLPGYVGGHRTETTAGKPRQSGGMTAEQFDRIFPVWATQYPGRVQVAA